MNVPLIRLRTIPALIPADGKPAEIRIEGEWLQWRIQGGDWINLTPLSDITGPEGEMGPYTKWRQEGAYLQAAPEGTEDWENIVPISDITGPEGEVNYQGPWGPGTYLATMIVEHGGSLWFASVDVEGEPSVDPGWVLMLPGVTAADGTITPEKLAPETVNYIDDLVSDAVPITATRNGMEALEFPEGMDAIETRGFAAVGDGGGGLMVETGIDPEIPGSVQDLNGKWFRPTESREIIDIRRFGIFGGQTALEERFSEAVAASAADGLRLWIPDGNYGFDDTAVLPTGAHLICHPEARFVFDEPVLYGFRAAGSEGTHINLTADARKGDVVISVTNASGLTVGDRLLIAANNFYGRDNQPRVGEHQYIESIDGNNLTISRPLYDSYLLSNSGFISKIEEVRDITIEGGIVEKTGSIGGSYYTGLSVLNGANIHAVGVGFRNWAYAGVDMLSVIGGSAIDCRFKDIIAPDGGLGYCHLASEASEGIVFERGFALDSGKIFDNSGVTARWGVARNITCRDSGGVGFKRQVFGTHATIEGFLIENCWGTAPQGAHLRGRNGRIVGCKIRTTDSGPNSFGMWAHCEGSPTEHDDLEPDGYYEIIGNDVTSDYGAGILGDISTTGDRNRGIGLMRVKDNRVRSAEVGVSMSNTQAGRLIDTAVVSGNDIVSEEGAAIAIEAISNGRIGTISIIGNAKAKTLDPVASAIEVIIGGSSAPFAKTALVSGNSTEGGEYGISFSSNVPNDNRFRQIGNVGEGYTTAFSNRDEAIQSP